MQCNEVRIGRTGRRGVWAGKWKDLLFMHWPYNTAVWAVQAHAKLKKNIGHKSHA